MREMKPSIRVAAILLLIAGCNMRREPRSADQTTAPEQRDPKTTVTVTFTYGSEKEEWIKDVTQQFNSEGHKTADGRTIVVDALPMGSGECIDEILTESRQSDITSPASSAFIKLGNAESRAKTGKDLVASTDNLVLSPVVIAMWKPMADAIGFGSKPVGWSDILALARDERGWAAYGHPEWGPFRFGHTSPESSNSGLISVIAEAYAATGKKKGLEVADVVDPKTIEFVSGIERSIVHYGSSTGFFGKKMFSNGPQYLSAAVMYENMVIEAHSPKYSTPFPVVAIYPKEGTFWSDHPVGIVERPWVTPEKREAAKQYIAYLLASPQQAKALPYGFRPASTEVAIASPIDLEHGVNPNEPQTTLEVPSAQVMHEIVSLWRQNKKHANITLVFDTSGSMKEANKMENARQAALQLVDALGDADEFSLLAFSENATWAARTLTMNPDGRTAAKGKIAGLWPEAGTALYDAVNVAYDAHMQSKVKDAEKISAIVVLTDGADTDSSMSLDELLRNIRFDNERHTIRVFTIAYGSDAKKDVLQQIADSTQAKFYEGNQQNIRQVLRDIATFF
jgi:Ca-activated chloride channel family protein